MCSFKKYHISLSCESSIKYDYEGPFHNYLTPRNSPSVVPRCPCGLNPHGNRRVPSAIRQSALYVNWLGVETKLNMRYYPTKFQVNPRYFIISHNDAVGYIRIFKISHFPKPKKYNFQIWKKFSISKKLRYKPVFSRILIYDNLR